MSLFDKMKQELVKEYDELSKSCLSGGATDSDQMRMVEIEKELADYNTKKSLYLGGLTFVFKQKDLKD